MHGRHFATITQYPKWHRSIKVEIRYFLKLSVACAQSALDYPLCRFMFYLSASLECTIRSSDNNVKEYYFIYTYVYGITNFRAKKSATVELTPISQATTQIA